MNNPSTLSQYPSGARVRINRFDLMADITLRMAEIGISKNCLLKVLHNQFSGPMIIECKDVQIALHRDIVKKMIVSQD